MRATLLVSLLGLGLLWSSRAAAADSSGFTLETGSPDALCPALEVTREVVSRRLGALFVEGRKGWRARYTIGHQPVGIPRDFIRLELFSPEGTVELRRDLPMEGDSCRTMAEVIALVLDRHFRGLGTEGSAPAPPLEPPRPSSPPPSPRERAAPRRVTPLAQRLSLEYAASHAPALPWLGLRGSTAVGSQLELGLGFRVGLKPLTERAALGASVEARPIAARVGVAWRLALPPGLLHVGPTLSLIVERATTDGLATRNDRTRVLWSSGLEAGFVTPLGKSWFVQGAVSADVLVTSGRFFIGDREVLAPPRLTLGSSLSFGYFWAK